MIALLPPGSLSMKLARAVGVAALLAAASPAWAAGLATVTGAQVAVVDDVTAVAIQLAADGSTPTVSPFRQTNPERLVLDIAGAKLAASGASVSGGLVTGSEFSTFNDGQDNVRLTLFLSKAVTWDVKADGASIVLTLRAGQVEDPLGSALGQAPPPSSSPSGVPTGLDTVGGVKLSGPDTPTAGATLTTLDFQQREKVSRVLIGLQNAGVAHLATRFRIEGCGVEHHHHGIARLGLRAGRAIAIEAGHGGRLREPLVAHELGLGAGVFEACGRLELAGSAGLISLAAHGGLEGVLVDGQAAFAADIGGEVQRKAIGVVEHEGRLAVKGGTLGQLGQGG